MGMEAERFFAGLPPFDPSKSSKDVRALTHWVDWLGSIAEGGGVAGAVAPGGGGGGVGGSSGSGGAGLPLPGSGAGCCWLDCCVKLAFLDEGAAAANGSWYMPSIRLVQTVGRAPP